MWIMSITTYFSDCPQENFQINTPKWDWKIWITIFSRMHLSGHGGHLIFSMCLQSMTYGIVKEDGAFSAVALELWNFLPRGSHFAPALLFLLLINKYIFQGPIQMIFHGRHICVQQGVGNMCMSDARPWSLLYSGSVFIWTRGAWVGL